VSLDASFQRAIAAVRANRLSSGPRPAHTRYGYLVVKWPLIEEEISAKKRVLIGRTEDLGISRTNNHIDRENWQRLVADVKRFLGPRRTVKKSKRGNIYIR
jgi:hypothetical protein